MLFRLVHCDSRGDNLTGKPRQFFSSSSTCYLNANKNGIVFYVEMLEDVRDWNPNAVITNVARACWPLKGQLVGIGIE